MFIIYIRPCFSLFNLLKNTSDFFKRNFEYFVKVLIVEITW